LRYERDGFSVRAAKAKGRPLPADHWYFDRPSPVVGSEPFYEAYSALATERHPDGPIPWSAAMAYACREGFERDLADALWIVVHRMDTIERQWRYDQLKAEIDGG
jgi:hypothetical protein